MTALQQFLAQSRAVQVLLVNELTIFLSFYMLYPYLAVYFRETLGFSAWTVGLVLGIRVLSQQGLNVIGGTLADRLGYKPLIIAGLALRAAGFALFGLVDSLAGTLVAAILSGLAGALFGPALRAYLAAESPGRRAEVFALANLAGQIGTLLGPPVGVALLGLSFRLVCLVAGAIFLGLMLLQFRYLPRRVDLGAEGARPVLRDWAEVLANRGFVAFSAVMLAASVLLSQMYLTLPLEARRATGSDVAVGALFVLSSILAIVGQTRVTAWCQARYRPPEAVALGLALMTVGFSAPLAAALVGHASPVAGAAGVSAASLGPTLVAMTFLTVGAMVGSPFALAMVPRFGRDRLIATYFGFYAMAGGLGSTVGNALVGAALDAQSRPGLVGLPWGLMLALGAAAVVALRHLDRRGLLA